MTTSELLADRVVSRGSLKMQWERRQDATGATLYAVVDQTKRVVACGLQYKDAVTILHR